MPRIFSESDREAIRQRLLGVGRELFLRFGLRKTSIEQLAEGVGIAKGTFYHFFDSKEDLCLEIYDREEEEMRRETNSILATHPTPRETIEALLEYSLAFVRGDSLLTRLRESGEFSLLARGVGPERLAEHLENDTVFAAEVVEDLRKKGATTKLTPDVAAGILRSYVMLTFHEKEIGSAVFPDVMRTLREWIAEGFTQGESHDKA